MLDLEALDGKEWRVIAKAPGYVVSSEGEVRSLSRCILRSDGVWHPVTGRKILPHKEKDTGYLSVGLGSSHSRQRVHRLVAEAFIPNPGNLPVVRHLNDVAEDNRVENLAWGTVSDNHYDRVRNGNWTNGNVQKTHCVRGHLLEGENLYPNPTRRICRLCSKARYREKKQGIGYSGRA